MTTHTYAIALAIPAALRADANALAWALGWQEQDGNTFSVPLSVGGAEPATHYGTVTVARPSFVATLTEPADTLAATDWPAYGLTAERVQAVLAGLLSDVRLRSAGVEGGEQWAQFLTAQGLERIVEGAP